MTYDKFALKGHHYGQYVNNDKPLNYSPEVEKVSVPPAKQKRKNTDYSPALGYIKEITERKSSKNNSRKQKELYVKSAVTDNQEVDLAEKDHEQLFRSEKELNDTFTQVRSKTRKRKGIKNIFPKYSVTEINPFADKMIESPKSRRSSGSDAGSADKIAKSGSSKMNEDTDNSEIYGSEKSSAVVVPKLDIGAEYTNKRKGHQSSFANNTSNREIGVSNPLDVHEEVTTKLPSIKCEHIVAGQKHNVTTKITNDPDKCMICEITEATAKYASVEANRLLLEVVYPHEFYDKFQRSGKRTRVTRSQRNLNPTKEQINICKPATEASKSWRRERTFLPPQPIATDPPNTIRDTFRSKLRERSEFDLSPLKRIKRDGENDPKKEIHLQCRAKNNALVVTDDSEGQKLVLKGLKGWIMKKEDICKNKMHTEIKKSLYKVNSLGMNFSLPEYNTSISERKLQFTRAVTFVASPHPPETQQPTRKSVTQNTSPRGHVTFLNPPRDVQSVPTLNGLQRGYTHVPKLFSDKTTEDSIKDVHMSKTPTKIDHKTIDNDIPFQKRTPKLSLPPLGSNTKPSSFAFTQF